MSCAMTRPLSLVALLLLLALPPAPVEAQAEGIPPTQLRDLGWLGVAAAEYLEAFHVGDADGLSTFFTTYRDQVSLTRTPAEVRVRRQLQFKGMLGTVEVRQLSQSEPGELHLVLHSSALDGWFELFFVESEVEPGKIGTMGLQPTTAPQTGSTGGSEELATTLEEVVERLREENGIPALAVAVAEDGGEVQVVVRGVRDIESQSSAEESDRFHIGSITKSMTASVAARLVERGTVSFELTLAEALPDLEMRDEYREVTLRQLLRHRAGVEPLLEVSEEREAGWLAAGTPPDQRLALAEDLLSKEPTIAPGSGILYSNGGYALVAVVLERAAGRAWETLMQEELFEPLGLETAGLGWPATAERLDQPRGHWHESGGTRLQELDGYDVGAPLAPAGDVHCSVGDLALFGRAHLRGLRGEDGWLTAESIQVLHDAPEGVGGYAMGWMLEGDDGAILYVHPGSAGTFYSFLLIDPAADRVVAVAMNDGDLGNDAVARRIVTEIARLLGE